MPSRRRIATVDGRAALAAWLDAQRGSTPHGVEDQPGAQDQLRAQDRPRAPDQPRATPAERNAQSASPDRNTVATAVRFTLEELNARAPGQALEVRVPPFGATQCIEGPRHTRGTPPGVVEMSPQTWLEVVTGRRPWDEALASGDVSASGERANLSDLLPLKGA
ncbi:sterol carrier family protein [Demequina aurantiaca]|uniref:sterol carrier family protein n=1 Tax=Demequina aurantiaca TaxID=676200 RepID=UPI003D33A701